MEVARKSDTMRKAAIVDEHHDGVAGRKLNFKWSVRDISPSFGTVPITVRVFDP